MPNPFFAWKSKHDKQANEFLVRVSPKYVDWEIVTLFYSALHLINTFFDSHQIPIPEGYEGRYDQVERYLGSILQSYDSLRLLSVMARYQQSVGNDHLVLALEYYEDIRTKVRDLG